MENPLPYLYSIEFTVKNLQMFEYPDLDENENSQTVVKFLMEPEISIIIVEDEIIDLINQNMHASKKVTFSLSEEQITIDHLAKINAYKMKCSNEIAFVGCYKVKDFQNKFNKVKELYDRQLGDKKSTPCCDDFCELAVFLDAEGKSAGCIEYKLQMTCYGPNFTTNNMEQAEIQIKKEVAEKNCLNKSQLKEKVENRDEFDEYLAQVNGNSLIVRVSKENPCLVTRVYDSPTQKNDSPSNYHCDQQNDVKFPNNFTCCECKNKFTNCNCQENSKLTEFQRKRSCIGKSYKNALTLPVIRGNLKYPGRFDDKISDINAKNLSNIDAKNQSHPKDVSEKYRVKSPQNRSVCLQVDNDNLTRELDGKCQFPKGIKMCRMKCEEDVDVFVLKIGKKKASRDGKNNEIELEMRTPRCNVVDVPRTETRFIQVESKDFDEMKKKEEEQPLKRVGKGNELTKKDSKVKAKGKVSVKTPAKKK